MIILGLTGSVGAGKTETSKFFKRKNIPIFDSDHEVKLLYSKEVVIKKVKKYFPEAFKNKTINKVKLAKVVFENKEKLKVLEAIMYKFLKIRRNAWIRRQFREHKRLVVLDVPLLFEKDNKTKYDKIILVLCSEKIQRLRVLKRDGWNEERLKLTIKQQLENKKKKLLADIIIYSDRGKRYVYENVYSILKKCYTLKSRDSNNIIKSFLK